MSNGVGTFNMGYNGSYQAAGVLLDEVKVYNYARTAKQIVSDMNAGHPNVGSPVGSALGHWKFDEGYGTTTGNSGSGGSIITGSLSGGATWTRDGKFGKAIVTNGTNTYASIPDNDTIDFTYSQDFAVSFWLKDGGGNATDDSVVEKWAGVGGYPYVFRYNNGGSISFKRYDGTNNPSVTGTKIVNDGAWHYIVGVKSGSTLYLYIDNAPVKTGTDTTTGTTTNSSAVYLGERGNGSQYWNGAIDEVKIYNFALTADEIKLDMNRGASQVLGSLSDTSGLTGGSVASNSASAEYCIPGDTATCSAPVGRWDFEEGNGGTVNDISGNSLTGTMTNNATWSSGKLGKAGNFNGASVRQGVQISSNALLNPGTGSFTTEAWIRTSQTGTVKRIVTKRGSSGTWYSMFIQNGKLDFETSVSYPTYYSSTAGNRTINDGKWHHVVMVRDTGQSKVLLYVDGILDINPTDNTAGQSITNSEIFEIGIWGSETYDTGSYTGKIDQVKTYNYARTPSQIAYDYNKGAPIAHWKMDECQGGTANDSSGNNNNGTITIGGSGTQTSAGTCTTASTAWGNGATGKYNASLNFDGNDDYITVAHTSQLIPTGEITLSAWVKTSSTIATIISKTDTSTPWNGYIINIGDSGGNDGKLCYWPGNYPTYSWTCTTSRTVNDSSWHHVLITHSGTTASYYIDGKFVESKTVGSRTTTSTQNLLIGEENATTTRGFNGQMDDVRIYNYALTVSQIKQLMNQGSAVRFGPSTGTP
ncbi:MAG: hypothetical protein COX79_05340 [Candidatus Levybacteria bacterium CG_4_10_14_0_2_um_filter_36_16]|nr:MAG: hypothetical protein COX79_05340 [Candidatus Levybacteria bacterium CG_4_10_14_0_2_um_filter_36_16]